MSEYVTAAELIRQLQQVPPKTSIILAKDAEGNGYRPLLDVSEYVFVPADGFGEESIYDYDEAEAEGIEVGVDGAVSALVLWPED